MYDDYDSPWIEPSEERQKPLLTRKQQRRAYWEEQNFWFYWHLMQWGSFPDYPITGFGRKIKEPVSLDVWIKQEQEKIEADRQYLKQRQQDAFRWVPRAKENLQELQKRKENIHENNQ